MNATKKLDVVGICGSLRRDSLNRKALRAAEELMPPSMTMQVEEIGDLPMYNFDLHQAGFPAPVTRLCERIKAAEAILLTIIYSDVDDKNDALDAMACAYFRKYPQARR